MNIRLHFTAILLICFAIILTGCSIVWGGAIDDAEEPSSTWGVIQNYSNSGSKSSQVWDENKNTQEPPLWATGQKVEETKTDESSLKNAWKEKLASKFATSNPESSNSLGWDSFNITKTWKAIRVEYPVGELKLYATSYSLSWSADIEIIDNQWRVSWSMDMSDTWKQVYASKMSSILTIRITWREKERYTLMVAWGDYYAKIEDVETDVGQTDYFIPTRHLIWTDFDDKKTGTFNMLVDNFYQDGTGTVYLHQMSVEPSSQEFVINWDEVLKTGPKSVLQKINTGDLWVYDISNYYPPIYSTTMHTSVASK